MPRPNALADWHELEFLNKKLRMLEHEEAGFDTVQCCPSCKAMLSPGMRSLLWLAT